MRLDPRLRAVLNEINCRTLADIGCDHGKIAVGALLEDRAERVIAVDVSEASLSKCRLLGEESGVAVRLSCRIGNGMQPLEEGEVDLAVIAGMGGREIVRILEASPYNGRLLLVPHQDENVLRSYLDGKYSIDKDFIVRAAGRYYTIIAASEGSARYSPEELSFGKNLPSTEAYREMLKETRDRLARIASKHAPNAEEFKQKLKEAEALCQKYGIS